MASARGNHDGGDSWLRAFGRFVVYLRMRAGLNQQELALRLPANPNQLSEWEWGKVTIRRGSISKLAKHFGLDPDDFVKIAVTVDARIQRILARYRPEVAERAHFANSEGVRARLEEIRRLRRDADAEMVELQSYQRDLEAEAQDLRRQLQTLDDG